MEFKPNAISRDEAMKIVSKFTMYNKGVVVGRPYATSRDWDSLSAKWTDLIDSNKFSLPEIQRKMKDIYMQINNLPVDDVLDTTNVAFSHKTERDEIIDFTYTDMYLFLREALRTRKETAEYKKDKADLASLEVTLKQLQPKDKVIADTEARVRELKLKLGIEIPVTTSSTTQEEPAAANSGS